MELTDDMIAQIKNKANELGGKGRIIIEFNSFNGYYEIWIEYGERFSIREKDP